MEEITGNAIACGARIQILLAGNVRKITNFVIRARNTDVTLKVNSVATDAILFTSLQTFKTSGTKESQEFLKLYVLKIFKMVVRNHLQYHFEEHEIICCHNLISVKYISRKQPC